MTSKKTNIAGYGLYYRANNALICKTTDRIVLQAIIDIVRKQLVESLSNQTIFLENSNLGRYAGVDSNHTLPSVLKRLEETGLIQLYHKAFMVNCDEYVTLVKHYESLKDKERNKFAKEFQKYGTEVLKNYSIAVKPLCREELLGMTGSSMKINNEENCKITDNRDSDTQKTVKFQQNCNFTEELNFYSLPVKLQESLQLFAEKLHFYSRFCNFTELSGELMAAKMQEEKIKPFKRAFETGNFPDDIKITEDFYCNFTVFISVILQFLSSKQLKNYSTDIIYKDKKENNERSSQNEVESSKLPEKGEEDFSLKPSSHVEDETSSSSPVESFSKRSKFFDKVEILDFSSGSYNEEIEERATSRSPQKVKRDYGFSNPYRNKPFLSEAKLRLISQGWNNNETVTSPAKFFVWMLYWGICDLYANSIENNEADRDDDGNYHPVSDDIIEERIKVPFAISKDDIAKLLNTIYDDVEGAIDTGVYETGNEKYTIGFNKNYGVQLEYLFEWKDCRDLNGLPAYRIDITKIRDIEAPDATEVKQPKTREEKKKARKENLAYFTAIMQANDTQLTELEKMMRDFANDFFIYSEDRAYEVKGFLNGKGAPMMGNELPGYHIKPWAVRHSSDTIHPSDLYAVFDADYADGQMLHWQSMIFSFVKAKRWHKMNGVKSEIIAQLQTNRPDE